MRLMVVGGGGREHAIIQKLRENPSVKEIFALPGNAGMAGQATCVPISATDLDGVCVFAREQAIDFAVVAPDDPLCLGLVDRLEALGIPAFGPTKLAAEIEGSKVFSKGLMKRYGIPTAAFEVFDDPDKALAYVQEAPLPLVVKADGLALGKGVLMCYTKAQAEQAVCQIMLDRAFGASGSRVVIEECMTGPEASLLLFTDGESFCTLPGAMDHKRAQDGDQGLNTGGMGVIAPNPYVTPEIYRRCVEEIIEPVLAAMRAEGRPFRGCLFAGLMITESGPKVIEFNCRFGDPEAQALLRLLDSDLLTILKATRNGTLSETEVRFQEGAACCVVLASGGYPEAYEKGHPIEGLDGEIGAHVDCAGVGASEDGLVTAGGRVLGVTAVAATLPEAIEKAYEACGRIHFQDMHYRRDIGRTALNALDKLS